MVSLNYKHFFFLKNSKERVVIDVVRTPIDLQLQISANICTGCQRACSFKFNKFENIICDVCKIIFLILDKSFLLLVQLAGAVNFLKFDICP